MPQHVPSPLRAAVPRDAQSLPALPPQPRRIVFLAHRDLGKPAPWAASETSSTGSPRD